MFDQSGISFSMLCSILLRITQSIKFDDLFVDFSSKFANFFSLPETCPSNLIEGDVSSKSSVSLTSSFSGSVDFYKSARFITSESFEM